MEAYLTCIFDRARFFNEKAIFVSDEIHNNITMSTAASIPRLLPGAVVTLLRATNFFFLPFPFLSVPSQQEKKKNESIIDLI